MSVFGNLTYISAYFRDNDRKSIISFWEEPDNKGELIEFALEATEDSVEFKELLQYTSMDEIHEHTWAYIKDSEQAFKDQVIELAAERGWLVNMDDGGTSDFHKVIVDLIFEPYDEEVHKEKLFFFKIQIFERDFIKECNDKETKRRLRRATTPIEALKVAIEIFESSQASASPDTSD